MSFAAMPAKARIEGTERLAAMDAQGTDENLKVWWDGWCFGFTTALAEEGQRQIEQRPTIKQVDPDPDEVELLNQLWVAYEKACGDQNPEPEVRFAELKKKLHSSRRYWIF